jgi:hypothetical protein
LGGGRKELEGPNGTEPLKIAVSFGPERRSK